MCQPKWMQLLVFIALWQIPSSMGAPPPVRDVDAMDTGLQLTPVEQHLDFLQAALGNTKLSHNPSSFGYVKHTREKRQADEAELTVTLFLAFVRNGSLELVKLIHEFSGLDVNTQQLERSNWTALMWAARFGHDDIVEYLLEQGADPNLQNAHGDTAIIWAAGSGRLNIIKMMCQHGADPNIAEFTTGNSAVTLVAALNRIDELRMIDKYCPPMDLDHKDSEGRTPINIAAEHGMASMVLLLSYHPNIDEPDNYGMTPLHWSTLLRDTSTLQAVLLLCPDLNSTNINGHTALDITKFVGNKPGQDLIEDFMNMPAKGCVLGSDLLPNLEFIFFDCKQMQCMCSGFWRQTGVRDPDCVRPQVNVVALQEVESIWYNITASLGPYPIQEEGAHNHEAY